MLDRSGGHSSGRTIAQIGGVMFALPAGNELLAGGTV